MHLLLSPCCHYLAKLSWHQQRDKRHSHLPRGLGQSSRRTCPIGSRHNRTVRLFLSWVGRHRGLQRGDGETSPPRQQGSPVPSMSATHQHIVSWVFPVREDLSFVTMLCHCRDSQRG